MEDSPRQKRQHRAPKVAKFTALKTATILRLCLLTHTIRQDFDIFRFTLGFEAWGVKTKEITWSFKDK